MIADYQFYQDEYYGDILTQEEFEKYATRADSYLEQLTMGRYDDDGLSEDIVTAVKMAECAIAEQCAMEAKQSLAIYESLGAGTLASESVGAHSVSYRSGAEIKQASMAEIKAIVNRYLGMTGLLYRGIPCIRRIP